MQKTPLFENPYVGLSQRQQKDFQLKVMILLFILFILPFESFVRRFFQNTIFWDPTEVI